MKRYFPFLRGKQNELMAVRELAELIAEQSNVIPILEPVNANATTRISLDRYIEVSMPFLFICNPVNGEFANAAEELFRQLTSESLMEYDNWTPALQVSRDTAPGVIAAFLERYRQYEVAIVYNGLPSAAESLRMLRDERVIHHVFVAGRVGAEYINEIDPARRVVIFDQFRRQARNADYPARELFTDMNTPEGNPARLDFGDFSMVGDYYTDTGGPAYAVAVHHIHYQRNGPGPLDISHFISERTETTADVAGKIIEAVRNLVNALDDVVPGDTQACDEYREMARTGASRGLGYLKRLAIKHHLELMLRGGIQL